MEGSAKRGGGAVMPSAKKKPATPRILEKDIQAGIREYLRLKGYYVIRHQQGLGCHRGLSDLTAVHPKTGMTIYIEVKKSGGLQSDHQLEFEREIKVRNGVYIVARSVDDVMAAVK